MKILRCALATIVCASAALAGQAPPPVVNTTGQSAGGDETILTELLKTFQTQKPVMTDKGLGHVAPGQAALCQTCSQPLYKHSDPGFECIPLGKRLQKIRTVRVGCPVCQAQFDGALPGNVNDKAGRDRDFCAHSEGNFAVHSNVWACPDCGYAAAIPADQRPEGFLVGLDGKPLDQATKDFVKQTLTAAMRKIMIREAALKEEKPPAELLQFSRYISQTQIPDWVKYDHALRIYDRFKPPHAFMARLFLEAAHACRREVCSQIEAAYLDDLLLEGMGKSIRRVNGLLRAECLALRRSRGDTLVDPMKPEADAKVLADAAARILQVAMDAAAQGRPIVAGAQKIELKTGDMLVLYINYAGFLDRLGSTDEADKALVRALSYIPERLNQALEDKTMEERIVQQLKLLRGIVTGRQDCLRREQDYLYKAAKHNMAAIRFSEAKFRDYKSFKPGGGEREWDAAPTAYLLGEMARRCGDNDAGAAWLTAAEQIIAKSLSLVDAADKANPTPVAPPLPGKEEESMSPAARERERLLILKHWAAEQRAAIKSPKPPDPAVQTVIVQVLGVAGITANAPVPIPAPEPAKTAPAVAAKADPVPGPASAIATREALLRMYSTALTRYRTDKKENPATLAALVQSGYVKAEDAHMDESGKLFCPETKERLGYMRTWEPGDKTRPVIFPLKPKADSKVLYADGEIRQGLAGQ
jgi:hypothetical protein